MTDAHPTALADFIADRVHHMLDRPQMYAPSPDGLESMLLLLEEIQLKFGSGSLTTRPGRRFNDYLQERNYGSACYCDRHRIDNPGISDDALWTGLVAAWEEFLKG